MRAALNMLKTVSLSLVAVAALPSLTTNASQTIVLCIMCSMVAILLSNDPYQAGLAWFVGALIAVVAVHERYRTI